MPISPLSAPTTLFTTTRPAGRRCFWSATPATTTPRFSPTDRSRASADLKGKKVGSGEPGSTPDQLTRLALRKLGIDPEKDVTLVHFDEGRNTDRVKSLLDGNVAGMMVTAEAMYELEKTGKLNRLTRLTDHKQLKIYAGGGADYAISAAFLKERREDAKRFMSAICEGIAVARKDTAKALQFVAKSGRDLDGAAVEYLYRLYMTDVIPTRPHLKSEGIDLAIQMTAVVDSIRARDQTSRCRRTHSGAGARERRTLQLLAAGVHFTCRLLVTPPPAELFSCFAPPL